MQAFYRFTLAFPPGRLNNAFLHLSQKDASCTLTKYFNSAAHRPKAEKKSGWSTKGRRCYPEFQRNKNHSSQIPWKEDEHPYILHDCCGTTIRTVTATYPTEPGHRGTLFPQVLVHYYSCKNQIKSNTKSQTLWRQAGFFSRYQMASSWWKTRLGNGEFSFRVASLTNLWHVYQWSVFTCMRRECVWGFI